MNSDPCTKEQHNDDGTAQLNPDQMEKLIQLQDLNGIEDTDECKALLESEDWDLEATIMEQLGISEEDNHKDNSNQQQHQEQNQQPTGLEEMGMDIGRGLDDASGSGNNILEDEDSFVVLTTEQIVQAMVDSIKEVNSVLNIPNTTVRILLHYFKWDKERLMEQYYGDNQEAMFREAHIISPFCKKKYPPWKSFLAHVAQPEYILCLICCLETRKSLMPGLDCGHLYCNKCWTEYLTMKIVDEDTSQMIECPGNCNIIVDDETVMRIITDPEVKLKYQHLITNSFVSCNRMLQWCPLVDCNNAVKVQHVGPKFVKCLCGHIFCFSCVEDWHDPVQCDLLKKWVKKCDDDSETCNWISANTKECPKCNAVIEKAGGCNHMICKNKDCKAEFCWMCLGPWESHSGSAYNCNRYNEDEAKSNRDAQEMSRSALSRYLFYCNRYMNHRQSLKLEHKLHVKVKVKMEEMQQQDMSWAEVQFLPKSLDILCECRRTLMYTYVFAYYLTKDNQSAIFEENQKDLETNTELLSGYLERDFLVDINLFKQTVQDKSSYCDSRRKVLLAHVHEGYEKDWWNYTEANC